MCIRHILHTHTQTQIRAIFSYEQKFPRNATNLSPTSLVMIWTGCPNDIHSIRWCGCGKFTRILPNRVLQWKNMRSAQIRLLKFYGSYTFIFPAATAFSFCLSKWNSTFFVRQCSYAPSKQTTINCKRLRKDNKGCWTEQTLFVPIAKGKSLRKDKSFAKKIRETTEPQERK